MKKVLKFIKNFIIIVFLIAYFSVVIGVSTLLIARNDFNYTQFGDKVIAVIDKESATEKYKENTIVLLKNINISDIKVGQEIFVYDVDDVTNDVSLIIEKAGKAVSDGTSSPYIVLDNLGTYYGQDYIAGVAYKTINDYGKYLKLLQGKWVFFGLLIVPCFFILIYEIYLLIIAIKYDNVDTNVQPNTQTPIVPQPQQVISPNVNLNNNPNVQPVNTTQTQINQNAQVQQPQAQQPQVQQQPQVHVQTQAPVVDVPLENLNVVNTNQNNEVKPTNNVNEVVQINDNQSQNNNINKVDGLTNEVKN